ncbi:hypothetical protein KO528_04050 [Saccharophagus degradans]|uniref:hypothetical protein n=1 Tax=Saccharophagus degradans TaxID=86304 RepID=UPI001C0A66A9|nr:hypothetical protein [Saccharophagus degradans]MBU2984506.1 hypothetical protein [Saccharophagus degradans]
MRSNTQQSLASLLFVLALCASYFLLSPGLSGPFLLDDFVHLPNMAVNGGVDTWLDLKRFVFSIDTSTGRPLSMLTFLINDYTWPSSPYSFKYTNLLIHLLNGVLVFVFCRQLLVALNDDGSTESRLSLFLPVLVMFLWLIHPLQISSVFMVIQRMTLLMGTVSLLCLIVFMNCRSRAFNVKDARIWGLTLLFGFLLALGMLIKETVLMVLVYVFVIEYTLFSKGRSGWPKWAHKLICFVGVLGLALPVLYYFARLDYMNELWSRRDFSATERLLSESRVLLEYLKSTLIPSMTASPYHDDFEPSSGLFQPLPTFLCVVVISFLLGAALYFRRVFLISFPILWFFGGHYLESTFLPIELYFEHRNYLPILGVFIALAIGVARSEGRLKHLLRAAVGVYVALCLVLALLASALWGDSVAQAKVWAAEHSNSKRAQDQLLNHYINIGDAEGIDSVVESVISVHGDELPSLLVAYWVQQCVRKGEVTYVTRDRIFSLAEKQIINVASAQMLKTFDAEIGREQCVGIGPSFLIELVGTMREAGKLEGEVIPIIIAMQTLARAHIRLQEVEVGVRILGDAYEVMPRYDLRLLQAYYSAQIGDFEQARHYVDEARLAPKHNRYSHLYKEEDIKVTEERIRRLAEGRAF